MADAAAGEEALCHGEVEAELDSSVVSVVEPSTRSGPIRKNKAFFFGNYDGYRYNSATSPQFQSIPTMAERSGNFSEFPQLIYDPTSATGTGVRTPFPNNVIPSDRISPISQSLASYLPVPTNGGIQNNYLAVLPQLINNDSTTNKVCPGGGGSHANYVCGYNGLSEAVPGLSGYTAAVTVTSVGVTLGSLDNSSVTRVLRIDVTVTDPSSNTITLTGFRTNYECNVPADTACVPAT